MTEPEKTDIKTEIANEAVSIVNGARRKAYGQPEDNFARIARLWDAHLMNRALIEIGSIMPADVAAMMRLMKEARLAETPDHRDSYVDLVGYALCGAEVAGVAEKPVEHTFAEVKHTFTAAPEAAPVFKVGDRVKWAAGRGMPDGTLAEKVGRGWSVWRDGDDYASSTCWAEDELVHVDEAAPLETSK